MMTFKARIIVIIIGLLFIAYAMYATHYNIAVLISGGIVYLIWSHLREGSVFMATQAFHKNDFVKTEALLAEIKNPDRLRKGRRNFYEFMKGNLALKADDLEAAEYHFQLASRLPWKRDYEKGMVLINLANINLRKGEYERVKTYVEVIRGLSITERQNSIVTKIENELAKHI